MELGRTDVLFCCLRPSAKTLEIRRHLIAYTFYSLHTVLATPSIAVWIISAYTFSTVH